MEIPIARNIMEANEHFARLNKEIFATNHLLVLNLMSAPGAGKTTLLEKTLQHPVFKDKAGVIEGDLATSIDEQRLEKYTRSVRQINTGRGCHLNAKMVHGTLEHLELSGLDYLFIENVGNLVCPASLSLGEDLRVVLLSLPEGEEKPLKYPVIFHNADVVIINKIDLEPYVSAKVSFLRDNLLRVAPQARILPMSAFTGAGIPEWCEWLEQRRAELKAGTHA